MATLLQLAALGYKNTYEAADGAAALQQLDRLNNLDIVICDIRMSQMDGVEFLRRLAMHRLRPAVLICSAVEDTLRRSVLFLASQLGLPVLGDIGKPIPAPFLGKLLQRHAAPPGATHLAPPLAPTDIDRAILSTDCHACYQPQYALQTLDVIGVDIQCCWQHPVHGLLSASSFIRSLDAGQRDSLGWHIAEEGMALVSRLPRRDLTLNVSIPLAGPQLQSAILADIIQNHLEHYRLSPASLSLEIDAANVAGASLVAAENLIRLRLKGCHLTLRLDPADLSPLHRLHQLPFDQIKLDARHVWPEEYPAGQRIDMAAVVDAATRLGIQVITDGITNWQQNQQLLHMGCQVGSGKWYAPPMHAAAFSHWIYAALLQRAACH